MTKSAQYVESVESRVRARAAARWSEIGTSLREGRRLVSAAVQTAPARTLGTGCATGYLMGYFQPHPKRVTHPILTLLRLAIAGSLVN